MNHIKEQFFPNGKIQGSRALFTFSLNNVLIGKQAVIVSNSLTKLTLRFSNSSKS